jgi:cytochrome P450
MRLHDIPLLSGAKPGLGHLEELRDDRFGFFDRLNRECGDIGRIRTMGIDLLFANSSEILHELLVEKAKLFVKSPGLRGPLKPLVGEGLFTSEGELWRRQRRLMAPLFVQAQMARYAEVMAGCASEAVTALRPGETFDAARMTTHIAMRIAGKALFDAETLDEADELGEALTVALRWSNDRALSPLYGVQLRSLTPLYRASEWLPPSLRLRAEALFERLLSPIRLPGAETRRIEAALATIDRRVDRMIADRRASRAPRPDLLSLLLAAQDEGGRMSDKQVRDEIVTLFVAGHETTATALAWSLYLLARSPEAYARIRAEARALPGPPTRSVCASDLGSLPYGLQVFKEAMRLYPPVYFFGRQAYADANLGGYDLPRGTIVLVSVYALHRRPEVWPDPERFDPSRFEPAAEAARHRSAYLPFSAGPRTCIGNHFALMEGPIVLATILRHVDLELSTSAPVEKEPSATLRPRGGVPMRVR